MQSKGPSDALHYQWMFFFHDWKASAVYHRGEPYVGITGDLVSDVSRPRTDILYVCACGKVKTSSVQGTWKLEEVQP